jgi:hypothetical protein
VDGAVARALEIEVPHVKEAAATFASRRFPRGIKLLRSEPLRPMVIGAFVRGLSMRDVESLCEKGRDGQAAPQADWLEDLPAAARALRAVQARDLYDVRLVALFLDPTFLAVRPDGPRKAW